MLLPDNHVTTLMQLDYQEALFYFQGGTGGVGKGGVGKGGVGKGGVGKGGVGFGIGNIFRTLI